MTGACRDSLTPLPPTSGAGFLVSVQQRIEEQDRDGSKNELLRRDRDTEPDFSEEKAQSWESMGEFGLVYLDFSWSPPCPRTPHYY